MYVLVIHIYMYAHQEELLGNVFTICMIRICMESLAKIKEKIKILMCSGFAVLVLFEV